MTEQPLIIQDHPTGSLIIPCLRDGEFVLAMRQEIIKLKTNPEAELVDLRMRREYMKHSI